MVKVPPVVVLCQTGIGGPLGVVIVSTMSVVVPAVTLVETILGESATSEAIIFLELLRHHLGRPYMVHCRVLPVFDYLGGNNRC